MLHNKHGKKSSAGTSGNLDLSLLASPLPTSQTTSAHATTKHPAMTDFVNRVNQSLQQTGAAIREAHQRRVEEDEEIRESVRRKNAPLAPPSLPNQSASHNQQEIERKKNFEKHMQKAQSYFNHKQYALARLEYESAFRTKLEGHNAQADLLWALVGINKILSNMDNANLYLNIAECHIRLKEYQSALNYLRQLDFRGTPIIDIRTRITHCEDKLYPTSQAVPFQYADQPIAATSHTPTANQKSVWDKYSKSFADTAKKLLAFNVSSDPNNQGFIESLLGAYSTPTTDYKSLLDQINSCIWIYDSKCQKPTEVESGLRSELSSLQSKIKTIIQQQEEANNRERYMKMAAVAEPQIIDLLHAAQKLLASKNFTDALDKLRAAQTLAVDNHSEYMVNQTFAHTDLFIPSITQLKLSIGDFNRTRETQPQNYAEIIVREALPIKSAVERKSLFFTHHERLIGYLKDAISKNWLHFYGKNLSNLERSIFQPISDLIKSDLTEIGFNQWFWRGGFSDELKLQHSHTIGPVLAAMIDNLSMTLEAYSVDLPIFAQTNTEIQLTPIPTAQLPQYDWRATLEQWPVLVEQTDASHIAQFATAAEAAVNSSSTENLTFEQRMFMKRI